MDHIERDAASGHLLMVHSESISTPAQVDAVRRLMKAKSIRRGVLWDVVTEGNSSFKAAFQRFKTGVDRCFFFDAVLLIPSITRFLKGGPSPHNAAFAYLLVWSQVPFFAFDRPELTWVSLAREMFATGQPVSGELLHHAWNNPRSSFLARSKRIRKGLAAAKARGVKLGNPRIAEAQAIAKAVHQARRPALETCSLMAAWKREGKSLRAIARALNERGILPPRGRRWYASSVRNQLT
jgi:hypothetical protein